MSLQDEEDDADRPGISAWLVRRLKAAALPALFLACCGYFVWHAVHGQRGLIAKEQREREIAEAIVERDQVRQELAASERRVQAMRGELLDRDQLDERARQLLNLIGPDEVVVPYAPDRRLF